MSPRGTIRTYGSTSSCAASSGASFIGSITNDRSTSPRSSRASSSSSIADSESWISTFGNASLKRRTSAGRRRALDALVGADAERPGRALGERGEIRLRGLHPRDDRLRVAQQQLPGLGERDRPRAARPLDQLLADGALERRDLLADRRLRVAERRRRTAERAVLRDGLESEQMAQLDAEKTISFHNGTHRNIDLRL